MREFYPLLAQCPLFQGIPQGELEQVLPRLGARTLRASRHQHLLAAGEPPGGWGSSCPARCASSTRTTAATGTSWPRRPPHSCLGRPLPGWPFPPCRLSVEAAQDSTVLLLDGQRLLHP